MREADLPSPRTGSAGYQLRRVAVEAISQLQRVAPRYADGKHPSAAQLRAFFLACSAAVPVSYFRVGNETLYGSGKWFGYLGPWGAGGLTPDEDFQHTLSAPKHSFPNGTVIEWDFPTDRAPTTGGVWGYDYVAYGNYTRPENGRDVPAMQLDDIVAQRAGTGRGPFHYVGWDAEGSTHFNAFFETYLNTAPDAAPATRSVAVDFFLHIPPETVQSNTTGTTTYVGKFVDGFGLEWVVWYKTGSATPGKYALIWPSDNQPRKKCWIDWGYAFQFLIAKGIISDTLYLTGIASGIEITNGGGKGKFTLNEVDVAFDKAAPLGYGAPSEVPEDPGNYLGSAQRFASQGHFVSTGDDDIVVDRADAFELTVNESNAPAGNYNLTFEIKNLTAGAVRFVFKGEGNTTLVTTSAYSSNGVKTVPVTLTAPLDRTQLQATGSGFSGTVHKPRLVAA